jgi:hypothetical protein
MLEIEDKRILYIITHSLIEGKKNVKHKQAMDKLAIPFDSHVQPKKSLPFY